MYQGGGQKVNGQCHPCVQKCHVDLVAGVLLAAKSVAIGADA